MQTYFSIDAAAKFIAAFTWFVITGTMILMSNEFIEFTELAKDITYCTCGISFIATIYTTIMLFKSKVKI
jgi:hypothetical protein